MTMTAITMNSTCIQSSTSKRRAAHEESDKIESPTSTSSTTSPNKRRRLTPIAKAETTASAQPAMPHPDEHLRSSPDQYLQALLSAIHGGTETCTRAAKDLEAEGYFAAVTEDQIKGYQPEIVAATRHNDIAKLKQQDRIRNYCNRFGESLLHISCRRGYQEIFEHLLSSRDVTLRCCDDGGRTPLHDACWHPQPQLSICQRILQSHPELLLIKDRRGFTPLQYSRVEHWKVLREFLYENRQLLVSSSMLWASRN